MTQCMLLDHSKDCFVANTFRWSKRKIKAESREKDCPILVRDVGLESSSGDGNKVDMARYGFRNDPDIKPTDW